MRGDWQCERRWWNANIRKTCGEYECKKVKEERMVGEDWDEDLEDMYETYSCPARRDFWIGGELHREAQNDSSASRARRSDTTRFQGVMGTGKKYN
jgi:hypothetical protein